MGALKPHALALHTEKFSSSMQSVGGAKGEPRLWLRHAR